MFASQSERRGIRSQASLQPPAHSHLPPDVPTQQSDATQIDSIEQTQGGPLGGPLGSPLGPSQPGLQGGFQRPFKRPSPFRPALPLGFNAGGGGPPVGAPSNGGPQVGGPVDLGGAPSGFAWTKRQRQGGDLEFGAGDSQMTFERGVICRVS